MPLIHIVQFKFKPTASESDVKGVCDRMLALKENCIHPTKKTPYIVSASGGRDNSPEGLQNGFTHIFVSEFESVSDRDFYVKDDKVHKEFVASISGVVDGAHVVDFVPGKF